MEGAEGGRRHRRGRGRKRASETIRNLPPGRAPVGVARENILELQSQNEGSEKGLCESESSSTLDQATFQEKLRRLFANHTSLPQTSPRSSIARMASFGAQARLAELTAAASARERSAQRELEDQNKPPKNAPVSLSAFTKPATATVSRNKGAKSYKPLTADDIQDSDSQEVNTGDGASSVSDTQLPPSPFSAKRTTADQARSAALAVLQEHYLRVAQQNKTRHLPQILEPRPLELDLQVYHQQQHIMNTQLSQSHLPKRSATSHSAPADSQHQQFSKTFSPGDLSPAKQEEKFMEMREMSGAMKDMAAPQYGMQQQGFFDQQGQSNIQQGVSSYGNVNQRPYFEPYEIYAQQYQKYPQHYMQQGQVGQQGGPYQHFNLNQTMPPIYNARLPNPQIVTISPTTAQTTSKQPETSSSVRFKGQNDLKPYDTTKEMQKFIADTTAKTQPKKERKLAYDPDHYDPDEHAEMYLRACHVGREPPGPDNYVDRNGNPTFNEYHPHLDTFRETDGEWNTKDFTTYKPKSILKKAVDNPAPGLPFPTSIGTPCLPGPSYSTAFGTPSLPGPSDSPSFDTSRVPGPSFPTPIGTSKVVDDEDEKWNQRMKQLREDPDFMNLRPNAKNRERTREAMAKAAESLTIPKPDFQIHQTSNEERLEDAVDWFSADCRGAHEIRNHFEYNVIDQAAMNRRARAALKNNGILPGNFKVGVDDGIAANTALTNVYANLQTYVGGDSTSIEQRQNFHKVRQVPDWATAKSAEETGSYFGGSAGGAENRSWTQPPLRVARDPRYRSTGPTVTQPVVPMSHLNVQNANVRSVSAHAGVIGAGAGSKGKGNMPQGGGTSEYWS